MDALLATGAGLVLESYLEELIEDKRKDYDSCSRETFDAKRGEVIGLQSLLNYAKKRGQ